LQNGCMERGWIEDAGCPFGRLVAGFFIGGKPATGATPSIFFFLSQIRWPNLRGGKDVRSGWRIALRGFLLCMSVAGILRLWGRTIPVRARRSGSGDPARGACTIDCAAWNVEYGQHTQYTVAVAPCTRTGPAARARYSSDLIYSVATRIGNL
jgi:hypothetical protein